MRCKHFLTVVFSAMVLTGCMGNSMQPLEEQLCLDLSSCTVQEDTDTHGGFHGDGTRITIFSIPEDELPAMIDAVKDEPVLWKSLPIDPLLAGKFWGENPYFERDEGGEAFPQPKTGYYCVIDRQEGSGDMWERPSHNFTFAVLDSQNALISIFQYDS